MAACIARTPSPVSGRVLAGETGVRIRTPCRDIASLQALGAAIEGEPGVGYVLKPGFEVDSAARIDGLHGDQRAKGATIALPPSDLDFGGSFVGLGPDGHRPDGHRLRVYAVWDEM